MEHMEVSIEVDTTIAPGVPGPQVFFETEVESLMNPQRFFNMLTFWSQTSNPPLNLPIDVEIMRKSTNHVFTTIYKASLKDALQIAVRVPHQKMTVRLLWTQQTSISRSLKLSLRMEVDKRCRNPNFSHINRTSELPDRTTLPPGSSQVLSGPSR